MNENLLFDIKLTHVLVLLANCKNKVNNKDRGFIESLHRREVLSMKRSSLKLKIREERKAHTSDHTVPKL